MKKVRDLLSNHKYVEIITYNRHYSDIAPSPDDPSKEVRKTFERPRSEWIVRRHHGLQAQGLPWKLWKAAQRRLKEVREASPLTGRA
jgi:hypothetical protein